MRAGVNTNIYYKFLNFIQKVFIGATHLDQASNNVYEGANS